MVAAVALVTPLVWTSTVAADGEPALGFAVNGMQIDLQVTGRGPVPQSGVEAVVLNVTGDQSSLDGFVTAWPTGIDRPVVSNLNSTHAGQTIPNAAIVPLGHNKLTMFTQSAAHLIVDIDGWYTNF